MKTHPINLVTFLCFTLALAGCGGGSNKIPGTAVTVQANLSVLTPIIDQSVIPPTDVAGTDVPTHATSFDGLNRDASFAVTTRVFDNVGEVQTIQVYFYHIAAFEFLVRSYVIADQVSSSGTVLPQLAQDASGLGEFVMTFDPSSGGRTNDPESPNPDIELMIRWNDDPATPQQVNLYFQDISAGTAPAMLDSVKAS